MTSVKALLFDMGGVVLGVNFKAVFKAWETLSPLSAADIERRFEMGEYYQLHEKGLINQAEYFAHLRRELQLTGTDAQLEESWNAIFGAEITESLDAIDEARNQRPAYLFTNTNQTHHKYWEARYPRIGNTFDKLFVSSAMGLRKPDAQAFQFILDEISVAPKELLFFDDLQENIDGAKNLGIQTVLVTEPSVLTQALKKIN